MQARPDWAKYFCEPIATRSSKPDSVAKEVAEKKEKRLATAPFTPFAATLTSVVCLDINGEEMFSFTLQPPQRPGAISLLAMETFRDLFKGCTPAGNYYAGPPRIYGLRIKDRLRIMALDALRYATYAYPTGSLWSIPMFLWHNRAFDPVSVMADPYDLLVPTELRTDVDVDCLCDFLGIPEQPLTLEADPKAQAELARQLVLKGGLLL